MYYDNPVCLHPKIYLTYIKYYLYTHKDDTFYTVDSGNSFSDSTSMKCLYYIPFQI